MTMAVTNPTTGLVEKEFPEDTAEDVEQNWRSLKAPTKFCVTSLSRSAQCG